MAAAGRGPALCTSASPAVTTCSTSLRSSAA
jgi:hypothetical protein